MSSNLSSFPIQVGESGVHGQGVFARARLPKARLLKDVRIS